MRVSLRDVGKQAGVSGATVSRVLNGVEARIPAETQARVRRIAEEMGYVPDRAARALATGRTGTVALWLPNLRSPVYAATADALRREAREHGYDLLIVGDDGPEEGAKLARLPVDGVLAVDAVDGGAGGKPWVSLGDLGGKLGDDGGTGEADWVRVDFRPAAEEATRRLAASGARRIAFVTTRAAHVAEEGRQEGYRDALAELGLGPEYLLVGDGDDPRVAAWGAVGNWLAGHGRPDALLCLSDDLALGACRALRERGLRVPQDVALAGGDGLDDPFAPDPLPMTLARPLPELCALAWSFLARRLADPSRAPQQATLPARLVGRG